MTNSIKSLTSVERFVKVPDTYIIDTSIGESKSVSDLEVSTESAGTSSTEGTSKRKRSESDSDDEFGFFAKSAKQEKGCTRCPQMRIRISKNVYGADGEVAGRRYF